MIAREGCVGLVGRESATCSEQCQFTPESVRAELCVALGADGLRGELTLLRAGRALAAYEADTALTRDHLRAVAPLALAHRLRRDPLDEAGSTSRVARTVEEVLG